MPESAPARSVTKSVAIDRAPSEVFAYLADARNWPQWSVVNVLAIEATSDPAWWKMTTPRGAGKLRIRGDAATGLLDHDFRDPQAAWTVPARVVANGRGAEFLITFFQPPVLDDEEFDRQAALVDTELATLKHILENRQ
jgi:Polyketide cyclase / dehydrase and lipid transport